MQGLEGGEAGCCSDYVGRYNPLHQSESGRLIYQGPTLLNAPRRSGFTHHWRVLKEQLPEGQGIGGEAMSLRRVQAGFTRTL